MPDRSARRSVLVHTLRAVLLAGFGILIAKLFVTGEMVMYMSPDLDWLTATAGAMMLAMGGAELWLAIARARDDRAAAAIDLDLAHDHDHGHASPGGGPRFAPITSVVIAVTLALGLGMTPQAITPAALGAESDGDELAGFLIYFGTWPDETPSLPPGSPIDDFVEMVEYLKVVGPNAAGQRATIVGLVAPSGGLEDDEFSIVRISIVHCVADGWPIGSIVRTTGELPAARQWVEIEGTIEVIERDEFVLLRLDADRVTPISQPARPYLPSLL